MNEVQILQYKLARSSQRLNLFKQRNAPPVVIQLEQHRRNSLSAALRALTAGLRTAA